ncbi:hypothetical protein [Blattabacterium cuenoti]|uniref:hypothetical protein n=1 Tax=Blattabacterium cuenoti TaxID=1653831 RepID=UPI00163D0155|nr:hypothetical protein [Blattabacterium cuenoti]
MKWKIPYISDLCKKIKLNSIYVKDELKTFFFCKKIVFIRFLGINQILYLILLNKIFFQELHTSQV